MRRLASRSGGEAHQARLGSLDWIERVADERGVDFVLHCSGCGREEGVKVGQECPDFAGRLDRQGEGRVEVEGPGRGGMRVDVL